MSLATETNTTPGLMAANDSESRPRPRSLGLNQGTSSNSARPKRGTRQLAHGRSLSHTKISHKATLAENRPNLLRLKSTDLIKMRNIKRNGRLYTKISGLQPLTKTMLNLLLKKGNSSGSLRNMGTQLVGLKATKKGKAILSLNDDDYDNYEDIDDEKIEGGENSGPEQADMLSKTVRQMASQNHNEADSGSDTVKSVVLTVDELQGTLDGGESSLDAEERQLRGDDTGNTDNTGVNIGNNGSNRENAGFNGETPGPNLKNDSQNPVNQTQNTLQSVQNPVPQTQNITQFTQEPENLKKLPVRGPPPNMNAFLDQNPPNPSSNASNHPDHPSTLSLPYNFYLGSLLLSQLTGVTRNIANIPKIAPQDFALETISGITFQAHPMDMIQPVAPVTTQKTVETNSYQPSHTIFNNLQRTTNLGARLGVLMAGVPGLDPNSLRGGLLLDLVGHYDGLDATFHNFLTLNLLSVLLHQESRTQQRLWLQRENSLMDVVGGENSGVVANLLGLSLHTLVGDGTLDLQPLQGQNLPLNRGETGNSGIQEALNLSLVTNGLISAHSMTNLAGFLQNSSIQLKTEFERLNREYLNVRRHLNPVAESVSRSRSYMKLGIQLRNPKREEKQTNNFQDFLPQFEGKEPEISALVSRLWQRALLLLQLGNMGRQNAPVPAMSSSGAVQSQRPPHARLQLYTQLQNSMRTSQTPTTRAVKLAQHQYRKNDQSLLNIA